VNFPPLFTQQQNKQGFFTMTTINKLSLTNKLSSKHGLTSFLSSGFMLVIGRCLVLMFFAFCGNIFCSNLFYSDAVFAQQPSASGKVAQAGTPVNKPVKENTPEIPVAPEVKAGLEKAVAAFNASKFPDALDLLKTLYSEHPDITPPRIVLAQWFAQANLGDAVRANLEMGTEENPDDPEAYLLLGEIALRQRSLTAAELLLKQTAEKIRTYSANTNRKKLLSSSLLRVFADLYEARQRWTEMEACLDEKMQIDGQNAVLLRQKGVAVFQQKRDDDAKKLFLQADQLDKTNTNTDSNQDSKGLPADAAMSQLYLVRGDRENAKKFLETALAAYPNSKEVLALSVQMRVNDDKLEEAKPLAEKLLADDPTSASAKRLCATVALYLQDYQTAEKLFQDLLLESPTDSQAANGLALALCEQESPEKLKRALEYAADNVRKNQNNSEFWGTLGWIRYKVNQLEQAATALKQSAATGQINAATAYYLARLAVKTGKNDEAKQLLNAALQGNNQFAKRREAVKLLNELAK
jgi:tetratricopeptide (TPR) repeat protein